ncbi:MAG: RidA family protein [Lachnospiraceae bacterium]|nr:RidA family protein [Lachnospiraceae bacterium]
MKKTIATERAPQAIGPYSQAIEAGGLIYSSGVIPVDPKTGEIASPAPEAARQAFTNLKNLLEDAGTGMDKVIKTTVFIANMEDFAAINEVYASFFPEPYPARSCVEVARLPKDVLLEVEAIAEK